MSPSEARSGTALFGLRFAALALAVAALGLPLNDLVRYSALLVAALVIFTGVPTPRPSAWLSAAAVAMFAVAAPQLWPSPRIEEGHNVFLPSPAGQVLEERLPADVYRFMASRFEARYPAETRCRPFPQCWAQMEGPREAYAFSADGLLDTPAYSRRVGGIGFSDPAWLRIGAVNDMAYNWYADGRSLLRTSRGWPVLKPWRLDMPFFVMFSLPAEYAGSRLCWTGDVLWEQAGGAFLHLPAASVERCREIQEQDAGRRIFGVAIDPAAPLSMSLSPVWSVRFWQALDLALPLAAALAVVLLLVQWRPEAMRLPLVVGGLGLAIVALNDVTMLGGVRAYDGGDDGMFYESVGRQIVQHLARGEIALALRGGEDVFYYGGPGLRYFRAIERFVFGDTQFGYLTLLLTLPLLVYALFARLLSPRAGLALVLVFVLIPVGGLFGTTFFQYSKWTARGFADPAAYTFFIAGLVLLVGRSPADTDRRFAPALAAGLMFALALFMRPIVAPAVAVLLTGAAIMALRRRDILRVAGLCLGFLPTFAMTLHNWVFGGVLVLFSANAGHPQVFVTPPAVYLAAARDFFTLDIAGESVVRVLRQIADWLSGPAEHVATVPLNAAGVAILVRVALARRFDVRVRLMAGAALAQHLVGLTHVPTARYYYVAWFMTLVVSAVWTRDEGLPWLKTRAPGRFSRIERSHLFVGFGDGLDRWMRWAGLAEKRA